MLFFAFCMHPDTMRSNDLIVHCQIYLKVVYLGYQQYGIW